MLNPLLLLFLPLALVPIALHLITLYRTKTVELSTYRFLMDSYVRQRQRIRLIEYLVMLLRFLFVLLIILALSRPVIERFGWLFAGQGGKDITLIVDVSATMNAQSGGESSMQRAKATAMTILGMLSQADHVTVIAAADKPEIVSESYAGQSASLEAAIASIEPTASHADLAAALQHMLEIPPRGPRSVYVLTDGQTETFEQLQNRHVLGEVPRTTQMVLVNVGPTEELHNVGIIGKPPQALRPIVGLPVTLTAEVMNNHPTQAVSVPLIFSVDDKQVEQVNLQLEPGEIVTHQVSYTPKKPGLVTGRFELQPDRFPEDDQFFFVLNVQPRMNVTLVIPDEPSEVAEDLYVRTALRSPLSVETSPLNDQRAIAQAMAIDTVRQSELNTARLRDSDVVVLCNVNLDADLASRLVTFVLDGGGLMIMPGNHVDTRTYQIELFNRVARASGASYRIGIDPPVGDPNDEASFVPIADFDQTHPVMQIFSHGDEREEPHFTHARLHRYFPLSIRAYAHQDAAIESTATTNRPHSLMQLPKQQDAIVEMKAGRGKIIVTAFSPTTAWSNMPLQPEFVPLMLRAMMALRPPADVAMPAAVEPGKPAVIKIDQALRSPQVNVTYPDDQAQTLALHRDGHAMVGALLDADQRGIYRVVVTAYQKDGVVNETLGVAVNVAPDQSRIQFANQQAMIESFSPHLPVYLQATAQDTRLSEHLSHREEIWRYLIWIVFLIIGVEFLIATLRVSAPDSQGSGANGQRSKFGQWIEASGLLESIRGKRQFRNKESP